MEDMWPEIARLVENEESSLTPRATFLPRHYKQAPTLYPKATVSPEQMFPLSYSMFQQQLLLMQPPQNSCFC